MTAPSTPADPPRAEPGKRPSGGDVGGVGATPETGVAEAAVKRGEKAAGAGAGAKRNDDDDDEWRHAPVAPVDEKNPLRSLGKAVGDAVTGSGEPPPAAPKR